MHLVLLMDVLELDVSFGTLRDVLLTLDVERLMVAGIQARLKPSALRKQFSDLKLSIYSVAVLKLICRC